jgi:anti-sigma regulatory factor (Ser/Thr protein kinase)
LRVLRWARFTPQVHAASPVPQQPDRAPQSPSSQIELPRHAQAGKLARGFVDEHIAPAISDRALGNVKMVVSELVNNAIVHGEGHVVLRAEITPQTVRLEVVDEGTGEAPAIRKEPGGADGGFGLRIVEALALRWGAFEGTTHVWAEIART